VGKIILILSVKTIPSLLGFGLGAYIIYLGITKCSGVGSLGMVILGMFLVEDCLNSMYAAVNDELKKLEG
jgi:hypothetical protein